ncbi:hypothetical protein, partial [Mycobacterium nebraskense]|uniref:hypothetical protein n=1 Tax=Mycobacterium nebraskense TaxID=244292 RepID=UPI001E3693A7
ARRRQRAKQRGHRGRFFPSSWRILEPHSCPDLDRHAGVRTEAMDGRESVRNFSFMVEHFEICGAPHSVPYGFTRDAAGELHDITFVNDS